MSYTIIQAHSPSETHASVRIIQGEIIVELDLPWTINDAARKYYNIPEGKRTDSQAAQEYIQAYIAQHFQLFTGGSVVSANSIIEIPQVHNHSVKYKIEYSDCKVSITLKNNLLIDFIGKKQKNYMHINKGNENHSILLDSYGYYVDLDTGQLTQEKLAFGYQHMWIGLLIMLIISFKKGISELVGN